MNIIVKEISNYVIFITKKKENKGEKIRNANKFKSSLKLYNK